MAFVIINIAFDELQVSGVICDVISVGFGFTVTENVCGKPIHPFAVGVAEIVPVKGKFPEFIPENETIVDVPLDARPIPDVVLVQSTVVFVTDDANETLFTVCPAQTVWLPTASRTGIGSIVIEKVCGNPSHPFALGVAVIAPVNEVFPVFRAVNDEMLPLPLVESPMPG
jgi:hypothetical protein